MNVAEELAKTIEEMEQELRSRASIIERLRDENRALRMDNERLKLKCGEE